ncbi:uncharacterized protein LOC111712479 isoform X2 [Eurytemora carolleeae]|uniref:uncharacterized protein LOC111712479 isoform X2 n=1 Tax=Eurytemora carolleeae TaxID=1294199 RepID=UPI000C759CAF|nr:uncharacterized protein LOC111712479 isoform X2 [Eurytemora carolleeae]XP_023342862.1 uncharacterized protein LOC111712479 isoform X2 [Eurytemora carolleeae]|eukprot:XP_023342861.1 uncharacterized protein LOC111712479 isoform X2 [Eurytemora affinis]
MRIHFGLFFISQCMGEKASYTFQARNVSLSFWNTNAITSSRKFRSNVEGAAALRTGSPYTAFIFKDGGVCEMAYVEKNTPSSPNPVKVMFLVFAKVGNRQVGPRTECPSSHPYPFKNGTKCCEGNLEDPFILVSTGTRGFLTINSTTCSYPSVDCADGWICQLHSNIENSLQMNADITPNSYTSFLATGKNKCQEICESREECQAWVCDTYWSICYLVKGEPMIKMKSGFTAGYKSSYINVPFA